MRFFEIGQSNLADPGMTNSTQVIPFWPTNISNFFGRLTSKNWAGNVGGRSKKSPEGGGGPEDGGPKGGGPPGGGFAFLFALSRSIFVFFFREGGLLVELWPRVEAQISRLGFSGDILCGPKGRKRFRKRPSEPKLELWVGHSFETWPQFNEKRPRKKSDWGQEKERHQGVGGPGRGGGPAEERSGKG